MAALNVFSALANSTSSSSSPRSSTPILRVLVIRHGETDWNVRQIIQGQKDIDLNERGRDQAHKVASVLAREPVDEVYTSPLSRARATAEAIWRQLPKNQYGDPPPFYSDRRLMERGFGVLEGATFVKRDKPDSIEGIEPMSEVMERVASFWNDLISGAGPWGGEETQAINAAPVVSAGMSRRHSGSSRNRMIRTVVIVGHGASLKVMVSAVLLGGGYVKLSPGIAETRLWNCSITEVCVPYTPTLPIVPDAPEHESDGTRQQTVLSPGHRSHKLKWAIRPPGASGTAAAAADPTAIMENSSGGDIGFGPGVGVVERWADVRHLTDDLLKGPGATNNVDEAVTDSKDSGAKA